jgi:peptidoglycan/LPS O-acetylase OafA/YrhL
VTEQGRIPELDGIRGVAIVLVLAFHLFWFPYHFGVPMELPIWLKQAFLSSWIGVDLFFALSGFLITRLLLQERERPKAWRRFFFRRALRIFPAYFLLLTLWIFVAGYFPTPLRQSDDWATRLSLWTYTSNWWIALNGWEGIPEPLAHTWTLAIEEQFYLLWPLLILFCPQRWALRVSLSLLILCPLARFFVDPLAAYVLTPLRLDALAAGAALALWNKHLPRWIFPGLLCYLLGLAAWREGFAGEDVVMRVVGLLALSLCFTAFIDLKPRVMAWGPLRWLGRYSYGIYLFHQPLVLMSIFWFSDRLWLYALVATASTLAAALISFHLWEKPWLSLRRFID